MNNEEKILSLLTGMDQRFSKMEDRFDKMEDRFDKLEVRLDNVELRLDKMDQRFDGMEQRFNDLEQEVKQVKQITLRMEHDHGKKLAAVRDGYMLNYDLNKEMDLRVTKLEHDVQKLTFEINYWKADAK